MSLLTKIRNLFKKKTKNEEIVVEDKINDVVISPISEETLEMVTHTENVADSYADRKKLVASVSRRRKFLQAKSAQATENIEKLNNKAENETENYFSKLYTQQIKVETGIVEDCEKQLEVTDEEAIQAVADKASLVYLKRIKSIVKEAEKQIKSRSNPVAKAFVKNIKVNIPHEDIVANIQTLINDNKLIK